MSTSDPLAVLESNGPIIKTFLDYLSDIGISIQLMEVIAKELFGQQVRVNGVVHENVAVTPKEIFNIAVLDVLGKTITVIPEFGLDNVIGGAASFELLVRYARKIDPRVFPPEYIPSDEVVNAALELFHTPKPEMKTDDAG